MSSKFTHSFLIFATFFPTSFGTFLATFLATCFGYLVCRLTRLYMNRDVSEDDSNNRGHYCSFIIFIIVLSPSVQLVYLDSNQQYNKITYNATI